MTVYSDNPAGRLHKLITLFRNNAGQSSVPHAWAAALSIPDVNSPDLLRRLSHVFRLPAEIEAELRQVDDQEFDSDHALRWRDTIPQGLSSSLFTGSHSDQLAARWFDDTSLSSLEHCSFVLHRHRPQRVFAGSELNQITELIAELEQEVRGDPGLDRGLRDFLLFHAGAMTQALQDLAVRGPAVVEEAFDQAVGATYRRIDLTVHMESHSGAWTKFTNLMIAVAAVLQIATSSFVLPGQIRQELDGPPPAQPAVVKVVEVPATEPVLPAPNAQHREKASEGSGAR